MNEPLCISTCTAIPRAKTIDVNVWSKYSNLAKVFLEDNDDDETEFSDTIDRNICKPWILGHIEATMTQQQCYPIFGSNIFIAMIPAYERYNIWLQIWDAVVYLDMEREMIDYAIYFIEQVQFPGLMDDNTPQSLWMFLSTNKTMYKWWAHTFFIRDILNWFLAPSCRGIKFNPRLYHPDLFWKGKPVHLGYRTIGYSRSSGRWNDTKEIVHWLYGPLPPDGCVLKAEDYLSWWHAFWDLMTIGQWQTNQFKKMLPWLIETNIFGMLGVMGLPTTLCPVTQFEYGSIDDDDVDWLLLLYKIAPSYFYVPRQGLSDETTTNTLIYGLMSNDRFILSILDTIPKNWHEIWWMTVGFHMKVQIKLSLVDCAFRRCSIETVRRMVDEGFRPSPNIYKLIVYNARTVQQFITGWYNILSMPGMPRPNRVDMDAMLNCIVSLTSHGATTNSQYLAKQIRDILAWHIHMNYMETISLYKQKNVEEYFCQFWFKGITKDHKHYIIWELGQKGIASEEAKELIERWYTIKEHIFSLKRLCGMFPTWSFDLSTSNEDPSSLEALMERCNIFPAHINGFMKILRIKKGN